MALNRRFLTLAVATLSVAHACSQLCQAQESATNSQTSGGIGSRLANLPGAKTASGIMASSADGLKRYFAQDGPIQPALTAIGGLPMRGAEMANLGISRLSNGFGSTAERFANSAGNDGTIRMPGLDTMESSMPASFSQMGNMMHGAIQQKNKFIMGQAEKGIQAGERLKNMMQGGLQTAMSSRSSGHMMMKSKANMMSGMGNMMGGAQDAMMKGTEEIKHQVKQSLEGKMNRMQTMMSMGGNMHNSAHEVVGTLAEGLHGAVGQLHKTGERVKQQLKGGMDKNGQAMAGMMGSMHDSMGNMGKNMEKNLHGVMKHAQDAIGQVSSHLQQAVSGKLEMVKSVGSKMGSMMMMPMAHGGGGSSGGRY